MLYLGRGSCLEENTRFLIDDVNRIECQIDLIFFDSAKIVELCLYDIRERMQNFLNVYRCGRKIYTELSACNIVHIIP